MHPSRHIDLSLPTNQLIKKRFVLLFFIMGFTFQTRGWGRSGHEVVAETAAKLSEQTLFFNANQSTLGIMSNVPDSSWKTGSTRARESYQHWFQPDSYFDKETDFPTFPRQYTQANAAYGESTLHENGTAPWRILQTYDLLVRHLESKKWVEALQMAGVMSHYIGDLSQPLHVTKNYDGQLTNQKGIHAFFESSNLSRFPKTWLSEQVLLRTRALLNDAKFLRQFQGKVVDVAFNQIFRSYLSKDKLLQIDRQFGRSEKASNLQIELALDRMADASATLAILFDRAWNQSGLGATRGITTNVPIPIFVEPRFYDERAKAVRQAVSRGEPKLNSPLSLIETINSNSNLEKVLHSNDSHHDSRHDDCNTP